MPRSIKFLIGIGAVSVVLDFVGCFLKPDCLYWPMVLLFLSRLALDVALTAAPFFRRRSVRWAMIMAYGFGTFMRGAVALGIVLFGHRWHEPIGAMWLMVTFLCLCVAALGLLFTASARQHFGETIGISPSKPYQIRTTPG